MPDELTHERAAEIWDGHTRQFIQMNPTIRFAVAQTPEEREMVYRIRYDEIIRQGWAEPAVLPNGMESDEYDEDAVQIVGWEGEQMIIVGRLVFPSPNRPLPTEALHNIQIKPYQQVVDTGRAVLKEANRGDPQHKLFLGLMSFAWHEMRGRGYSNVCAVMTASMLRLYQHMGIHWEVLGEPRLYWGEMRYPCKYGLVETVQSFLKSSAPNSPQP